jgi:hypothetical protein
MRTSAQIAKLDKEKKIKDIEEHILYLGEMKGNNAHAINGLVPYWVERLAKLKEKA